jgi:crossover junction endodeoxyribonuclease RusA
MDLDNALKVSIDALKGIAYADDSQVYKITAWRADPEPGKRLEVEILPYTIPMALEAAA